MERFYLKKLFLVLITSSFLAPFSFSQEEIEPIFPIEYFQKEIDQLNFREEANLFEMKLINLLEKFFAQNGIIYQKINYFPSPIIQSFSEGLQVSFKGNSVKNNYFIFPLDQKKGSSPKSNNLGILLALQAILEFNKKTFFLEENLHFLFLGGELTRDFPVGSRFFIENSSISLNNSFFYYFEVSSQEDWQIRTQGNSAFYITPQDQLKILLINLKKKKINFNVLDSYPLKNSFISREPEPFNTYDDLLLPLVTISSKEKIDEEEVNIYEILKEDWSDFFYSLASEVPIQSFNETNNFYLFFQINDSFIISTSSFYIIFIFILVNLIAIFSLIKRKVSYKIINETYQSLWFFVFIFFLFFSSLTITSWILPFLIPNVYSPSSILIYFKLTFASFISFSFLYLVHKSLTIFYKQSFLYMSLFFFFSLGIIVSFYNILSSFFFIMNGLLIFLGILSPPFLRLIFNIMAFASFFFFIEMGMSDSWIDYFESINPKVNLIVTSVFLPFLFLILSYMTPSKTKLKKRRYSRHLFSKIQISLLLSTLFASIISFEFSKTPKIEEIYIWEIWNKDGNKINYEVNYFGLKSQDEKIKDHIEILLKNENSPDFLKENQSFLFLSLEDIPAFKRNDYIINIQFPFQPETLNLSLNTTAQLIPIIYKSSFPYEIKENNELSFIIGPNPPIKLNINLSLEESPSLLYTIKFSRLRLKENLEDIESNKIYKIYWYQEILQKGGLEKERENTSNLLDVSELEKNPNLLRLKKLDLPNQSLFP